MLSLLTARSERRMHLLQCMRSAQKALVQSWKPKRHVSCHSCHHCAGGGGGELLGPRWPSARHQLAPLEGRGPDSLHVPAAMPQAAADLSRLPHWYWLASSCAYAAAIMATAIWQNEAATDMGKEDMVMMTMGIVSGAMFFVTAVSPTFRPRLSATCDTL